MGLTRGNVHRILQAEATGKLHLFMRDFPEGTSFENASINNVKQSLIRHVYKARVVVLHNHDNTEVRLLKARVVVLHNHDNTEVRLLKDRGTTEDKTIRGLPSRPPKWK